MHYRYRHKKQLSDFSRSNRRSQTDAEKLLWHHPRNSQIADAKFRRQYPIGSYIIDFYCPEKKLAIELEGSQHLLNKAYDERRDKNVSTDGIVVIRFLDTEVFQNLHGVLEKIVGALTEQ